MGNIGAALPAIDCFKYGLSSEDASDIFQSVWMTLFQQLPSLKKQEKLSSWIITVTVRECWKLKKRSANTESLDDPESTVAAEAADQNLSPADDSLLMFEQQHLLRRAIELLPEQCRRLILRLFYRDESASYAEISLQLGMPVASIGPTRARCLDKLKASLKKLGIL
ncbi:MAG TPA: sigma-70 family RNA polymerase sigma factor [Blastocatellia bacterium]|nr:sigma-70 family RNA polymerase sigma factor [Blastocatellia bacterium]HMV87550.1 sigma-70 family RNA polymerase sigma factor [Blastocatellia bacterium]HMX26070.1 sigma-70 family RNA polymerase sigma factor [Blastocatellia bacterium]HMY71357.1 sigma-70 family RNA polymerase sigma factor [Blastocatellia bacterium]HMZ21918.1 sigma-70 family RNA polymerase sigma factor [Blastocatellia bacterium]